MKRLLQHWQNIRYSLWFIPALIVALAVALAALSIWIDVRLDSDELPDWPRLIRSSADGSRGTLEVIASAMITIAALTFSITILVLSSVAAQYTPRIIRTFMGSTMTKSVLGVFVGVYVYCLIVLRTVRGSDPEFVPAVGVTIALLLALVGVGFLIAFIHHMASSIQVSTIVAGLGEDTIESIESLFPNSIGQTDPRRARKDDADDADRIDSPPDCKWIPVASNVTGYVQAIDTAAIARHAGERGILIRMEKSVGEFVMKGEALACASESCNEHQTADVNGMVAIGAHRTVEQDVAVGIRQLSDIALRAISPAINDTTTASMAMDYMTTILIRLVDRQLDSETDTWKGKRTLIVRRTTFAQFLRMGFEKIRQHADGDLTIYLRLLDSLEAIARASNDAGRRATVQREAALVASYARAELSHADQQARVEQAWQRVQSALQS